MKLTYFLRGLGIGILFCSLIFFVSYKTMPQKISDEDVIKRAKELGMVEGDDEDSTDQLFTQEKLKTTTENADKTEKTDDTTKDSKMSKTDKTTEEITSEEVTEATTEIATEATTETVTTQEEKATTEVKTDSKKVQFTITNGMYSESVASTLKNLGVIDDAAAFNKYLCDNGYASRMMTGTYEVTPGEDYYSIASKITR